MALVLVVVSVAEGSLRSGGIQEEEEKRENWTVGHEFPDIACASPVSRTRGCTEMNHSISRRRLIGRRMASAISDATVLVKGPLHIGAYPHRTGRAPFWRFSVIKQEGPLVFPRRGPVDGLFPRTTRVGRWMARFSALCADVAFRK